MSISGIDLFSGAGGMSVGAEMAGVRTKVAIESDPRAAATFKANHPNASVINSDIRSIEDFAVYRQPGTLIVYGGPPCQGFSTSNQRTRGTSNEANWLFTEYLRAVRQLQPEFVIFENVRGIVDTEKSMFLELILEGLCQLGYETSFKILNAAHFGVPQTRSRLFVVGTQDRQKFVFPNGNPKKNVSVFDAFNDLPKVNNGCSEEKLPYKNPPNTKFSKKMRGKSLYCYDNFVTRNSDLVLERYKHIPPGGNWEDIPLELMKNYSDASRCHTGIYRRLDGKLPSITIGNYRKNMLIHPTEHRGLSVREAARLQSFPDWFHFSGSIGFRQQQVGNAVPPLLAKAVFRELIQTRISGSEKKST